MAKEEQKSMYLLAIVAIVAIVGIVILILQGGRGMMGTSTMMESTDVTGQAYTAEACPEAKLCAGTTSDWVTCSEQDGACVCAPCAVMV